MGLSWSSTKNEGTDLSTPEWTSIDSKPVDKLYEPIAISTRLPTKTISRIRSQRKMYTWNVEFEVDVAYLQRRFRLCTVPTSLSDGVERILVTPHMMRAMTEDNNVGIDEMCNICALHIILKGDDEPEINICLVVDVSRDGDRDKESEAMCNLTRRIYGYTNQEPQDHVMR
ncbi:hypothetical protein FGB62_1g647 [Gracilaria domingensis]|nr:hypothetical protein FGB62_1g647 [Gracilaria domingensis]